MSSNSACSELLKWNWIYFLLIFKKSDPVNLDTVLYWTREKPKSSEISWRRGDRQSLYNWWISSFALIIKCKLALKLQMISLHQNKIRLMLLDVCGNDYNDEDVLTDCNHVCLVRIRCISGHIRLCAIRPFPRLPLTIAPANRIMAAYNNNWICNHG